MEYLSPDLTTGNHTTLKPVFFLPGITISSETVIANLNHSEIQKIIVMFRIQGIPFVLTPLIYYME